MEWWLLCTLACVTANAGEPANRDSRHSNTTGPGLRCELCAANSVALRTGDRKLRSGKTGISDQETSEYGWFCDALVLDHKVSRSKRFSCLLRPEGGMQSRRAGRLVPAKIGALPPWPLVSLPLPAREFRPSDIENAPTIRATPLPFFPQSLPTSGFVPPP